MVDGRELTEILKHHQHVLDPYRFRTLRAESTRQVKSKRKENPSNVRAAQIRAGGSPNGKSLRSRGIFVRYEGAPGTGSVNLRELGAKEQDLRGIINPKQERD
jgi:hypothetical protein